MRRSSDSLSCSQVRDTLPPDLKELATPAVEALTSLLKSEDFVRRIPSFLKASATRLEPARLAIPHVRLAALPFDPHVSRHRICQPLCRSTARSHAPIRI
eukprot:2991780-Prymnesium_polylepis.1